MGWMLTTQEISTSDDLSEDNECSLHATKPIRSGIFLGGEWTCLFHWKLDFKNERAHHLIGNLLEEQKAQCRWMHPLLLWIHIDSCKQFVISMSYMCNIPNIFGKFFGSRCKSNLLMGPRIKSNKNELEQWEPWMCIQSLPNETQ